MKPIVVIIIVIIVGGVGYWLISPLFLTRKVHEAQVPQAQVVSEGMFVDADSFHKTEGTAQLLKIGDKYYVRFEEDFKTTNGPDLFVHFGKNGEYAALAKLGGLKGNVGAQNYEVPLGINPLEYNEVWIWCRVFSVPFGHARFTQ